MNTTARDRCFFLEFREVRYTFMGPKIVLCVSLTLHNSEETGSAENLRKGQPAFLDNAGDLMVGFFFFVY